MFMQLYLVTVYSELQSWVIRALLRSNDDDDDDEDENENGDEDDDDGDVTNVRLHVN